MSSTGTPTSASAGRSPGATPVWAASAAAAFGLLRRWAADAPHGGVPLPPPPPPPPPLPPGLDVEIITSVSPGSAFAIATSGDTHEAIGHMRLPRELGVAAAASSAPTPAAAATAAAAAATTASATGDAAVTESVAVAGVKRRRPGAAAKVEGNGADAGASSGIDARARKKTAPQRKKCEHGRQRSKCKDCGGCGICEHGHVRTRCKECGGGSICEHGRFRNVCKECGGSSICEHGRRQHYCRDCGGASMCEQRGWHLHARPHARWLQGVWWERLL